MLDRALRRRTDPLATAGARRLAGTGISPAVVTATGLLIGLGAAVAAAAGWWTVALIAWLVSRAADGLDGALARLDQPSPRGGFADIVADFTVYGSFVVGVAVNRPDARLPAVVLLCTYYVSGSTFLAWSSLAGDRGDGPSSRLEHGDARSLRFVGGLAEGFETIVAHSLVCLFPHRAALILWSFAVVVAITAGQRIVFGLRTLPGPGDLGRS